MFKIGAKIENKLLLSFIFLQILEKKSSWLSCLVNVFVPKKRVQYYIACVLSGHKCLQKL